MFPRIANRYQGGFSVNIWQLNFQLSEFLFPDMLKPIYGYFCTTPSSPSISFRDRYSWVIFFSSFPFLPFVFLFVLFLVVLVFGGAFSIACFFFSSVLVLCCLFLFCRTSEIKFFSWRTRPLSWSNNSTTTLGGFRFTFSGSSHISTLV